MKILFTISNKLSTLLRVKDTDREVIDFVVCFMAVSIPFTGLITLIKNLIQ
jgi:hypothetical protein